MYPISLHRPSGSPSATRLSRLLELELAAVVGDALGKVDVMPVDIAVHVGETGTENGNVLVTLQLEGDTLGAGGEVTTLPLKEAVVVAKDGVEVELSVNPLALTVVETGTEDVAVIDADVLGREMERHGV